MPDFTIVEKAFEEAIGRNVFPGAVCLVNRDGEIVFHRAFGNRSLEPTQEPLHPDIIYDLSSLTKPLATTTAFLLLAREGKLRITDRITRLFHNFGVHGKTRITFRHLLSHTSGLPAWRPFYKELIKLEKGGRVNFLCSRGAKQEVYDMIRKERPEYDSGSNAVYSDLGFMVLGEAIEDVSGMTLDQFCTQRIFRPLGMRSTSFVDLSIMRTRRLVPVAEMIAPTESCPWRNRVLCGEVHDDNAYAMGGVAGHAGLFGNARDLDVLLSTLRDSWHGHGTFLPQGLVREAFHRDPTVPSSTFALGWDTPSPSGSQAGSRFSRSTVGHLGFTGTSVWMDLERGVHVILLSNRVHPSRDNDRIRSFRPYIHDAIWDAMKN